jgi:hypothetical protein
MAKEAPERETRLSVSVRESAVAEEEWGELATVMMGDCEVKERGIGPIALFRRDERFVVV